MTGNIPAWPGTLFGLLHVSTHQQQHANLKTSASALDVYLGCAALCAKTMASVGQHFRLITNAPEVLAHRAEVLGLPLIDLAPYEFRWSVPPNLRFHSAHYKLEIYQAFGEGIFGAQVGLVDIDTVMFRRFAGSPPSGGLMTYDISAQYLDLAPDRVKGDLEQIVGRPLVSPKWYGGELLCGDTTGFKRLHGQIEALWPQYLKVASELDHVGDEAIVSAALALLRAEEFPIVDAGASGDIARWWSGRVLHHQDSFAHASQAALLHLPSDKTFLARAARRGLTGTRLHLSYRRYLMRRLTLQQAVRLLGVVRGRPREYVPRLR